MFPYDQSILSDPSPFVLTDMDVAHMKQDSLYPFNTCVCLEMDALIQQPQVEEALSILQPLHPKLNVELGRCTAAGDICLIPKDKLSIVVEQGREPDELALHGRIQRETERPFLSGEALLRLISVTTSTEEKHYILFVHSHAIMDGASLLSFINHFLKILDCFRQDAGVRGPLLQLEACQAVDAQGAWSEVLRNCSEDPVTAQLFDKKTPDFFVPFQHRRTGFAHFNLTQGQTALLLQACKSNGVSIYHALSAASLLVQNEKINFLNLSQGDTEILCKLILSLRTHSETPIPEAVMGNYITISLFMLKVQVDDDLWSLAHRYQAMVQDIIENRRFNANLPFRQCALAAYEHISDLSEPMCQWSNLGKIDAYFDDYATLTIRDFTLVCNSRESAHACSFRGIMYTFQGRLKTSLWCVEPFLNAWDGLHMLRAAFDILSDKCGGFARCE